MPGSQKWYVCVFHTSRMSLIVIRMHRFAFVDKQPDKLIVLTGIKDNKVSLVLKKRVGLEMLTGGIVLYVCVNCP